MNCSICLNEIEKNKIAFNCSICNDGKICKECYETYFIEFMGSTSTLHEILTYGFNYKFLEEHRNKFKKSLSCPCCRNIEYKHIYNEVMDELKNLDEYVEEDTQYYRLYKRYKRKPIFKVIFKGIKVYDKLQSKYFKEIMNNKISIVSDNFYKDILIIQH